MGGFGGSRNSYVSRRFSYTEIQSINVSARKRWKRQNRKTIISITSEYLRQNTWMVVYIPGTWYRLSTTIVLACSFKSVSRVQLFIRPMTMGTTKVSNVWNIVFFAISAAVAHGELTMRLSSIRRVSLFLREQSNAVGTSYIFVWPFDEGPRFRQVSKYWPNNRR